MTSISVLPLKMFFLTNFKNEKVLFNKSILYSTDEEAMSVLANPSINIFPYVSLDTRYSNNMFSDLIYSDVISTIFQENSLLSYIDSNKVSDVTNKNEIVRHNIIMTLRALFPVSFPVTNDIYDSLSVVTSNKATYYFDLSDTSKKLITRLINGHNFSYIKYENNIYTFSRLVWLNDMLNHPLYNGLLKSYNAAWNKLKTSFIFPSSTQYDMIIEDLNEHIDLLLVNIYEGTFVAISDSDNYYQKFHRNDFKITTTFTNLMLSIFTLKHILLRANLNIGDTLSKFKIKIKNFFNKCNEQIEIKPKILLAIFDVIDAYDGSVYYIKDNDKEHFGNIQIKDLKKNKNNIEKEISFSFSEKTSKDGKEEFFIDDIYYYKSGDDEISNINNKLRLIRILYAQITALKKYVLKTGPKDGSYQPLLKQPIPFNKQILPTLLNKIFDDASIIMKTFESRTENLENSITYNEKKIKDIKLQDRDIINWKNKRNKFSGIERNTTNSILNEFIQNEEIMDEQLRKKFDPKCLQIKDIFPRIYNRFIIGSENNNCLPVIDETINVGASLTLRINSQNESKTEAEIYVMTDFLKGKITNDNINGVKCFYYDKQLGLLLNDTFFNKYNIKTNRWDVKSTRLILDDDIIEPNKNNNINNNNNNNNKFESLNDNQNLEYSKKIDNPYLKEKFDYFALNNEEIKTALNKYNNTSLNRIDEYSLLYIIKREEPMLYTLIVKWNDSDVYKELVRVRNFNILYNELKSRLETGILNQKEFLKDNINISEDDSTKRKDKIEKYSLYLVITNNLNNDYKKKQNSQKAGIRKTKKKRPNLNK